MIRKLYQVWYDMHRRCFVSSRREYKNYGGRGISVCARWESFDNFVQDMAPTWKPGLTLGRVDNDGNYTPKNCSWQTLSQQHRNYRQNRKLRFKGKTRTVVEWSEIIGIRQQLISNRLFLGWTVSRALSTPVRPWPKPKSQKSYV